MAETDLPQPRGPEEHKAAAKALGLRGANQLYVLGPDNDPFYKGADAHIAQAEWFADVLQQLGYTSGIYNRRVHYRLVSDPAKVFDGPDGKPYLNTIECWKKLVSASGHARVLGLVDAQAFIDKRNPDPIIHRWARDAAPDPSWSWRFGEPDMPTWTVPELRTPFIEAAARFLPPFVPKWELPAVTGTGPWWDGFERLPAGRFDVAGYDYDPDDQPVVVEVWVEKSTQNDILGPLCRELHVNLVPALGIQSITAAVNLVQRVRRHGKPAHVLYISDFDPAGVNMPRAVARQVEFWRQEMKIDVDITLDPLMLSPEQAGRYELARIPIKEKDLRKAGFEQRHGEGAVELDALEAKHPGEMARLVRDAIEPYVDRGLKSRLSVAEAEAKDAVRDQWADLTEDVTDGLDDLEQNVRDEMAEYESWVEQRQAALEQDLADDQAELDQIRSEMEAALAAVAEPYHDRLDAVRASVNTKLDQHREAIRDEMADLAGRMGAHQDEADALHEVACHAKDEFEPQLPDRPEPVEPDVDRDEMLFDSARPWLNQIEAYRAAKGGTS